MRRFLILGGAGLVGSHLCDRLLAAGREVIVVDDLSSGSYANVAHWKFEPRFAFVEHDVRSAFDAKVDVIFHLALPSSRASCRRDPVGAAMTCIDGTRLALDAAARAGARLVIVTSTERWGHGARSAESFALDFAKQRGLDVRIVRHASVYGARMAPDGDHVVSTLALRALRGETLEGGRHDATDTYRVVHVDEVVETLVRTIVASHRPPPLLAGYAETSFETIARIVTAAAHTTLGVTGTTMRGSVATVQGNTAPHGSVASFSNTPSLEGALPAAHVLGPLPSVELADGVARTVTWFAARIAHFFDRESRGAFARTDAARETVS
ncbi:UDP-glucose 4-epimerase [Labilithrix luteola]|uniref:UDP-glucose 4-epimerase n=1 Tax=Labilithrix luteola TaxID=1391654 RepID=A0A0K1Q0D4_9BACT|nr:NAD-dependent epimerase/dehydratase family protein [Labilithrix luteola]AKU99230.1 UDP-glucose 4-epimerase [Labilithrix luteola]